MSQLPRSSRRQKIEPLNWTEAAQAPALKGMTSFLDVSAEDVRNGTFHSFGPHFLGKRATSPDVDKSPEDETTPGDETISIAANARQGRPPSAVTPITVKKLAASLTPYEASEIVSVAGIVSSPGDESDPGVETYSAAGISSQGIRDGLTPGRGRSKVRRCVLAQDGHSLGEEAIYQVMWRAGRPENGDPNCARSIRIGAADIGCKVNMAKKNVRQNISRLFEKLAIEILEDFETMSSQARLYRVYSYKQILERRRAAGLDFVLRNKGVVFCTADGESLVSSPAYVSSPGDETYIRPAPPKKRRLPHPPNSLALMQRPAPSISAQESSESMDVETVSQALNRYWPVDQLAAVQLIRDCRRVRPDATVEEISFFVREKLELARQNRNISNPTGLILATVPQSFVGSAFVGFRERMERQALLAAEELQRKEREQAELSTWLLTERERFETIAGDSGRSDSERDAAENRLRQLASWNP